MELPQEEWMANAHSRPEVAGASGRAMPLPATRALVDRAARVAVVDDDDSIRFLVETLLERDGIAAESYASAEAFLEALDDGPHGCLVLDLHLPGINGLELQQVLARDRHRIPIIFFTARGTVPDAVSALKNGAVDFIEKPFDNRELLEKIRQSLAAGAKGQDGKGKDGEKDPAASQTAQRLNTLTSREREVMERVVSGRLNKSIADELGICIKTVEYHRARVMQKTGARSVAQLVQLALAAS
jgi:FixJ family two-component response regulator